MQYICIAATLKNIFCSIKPHKISVSVHPKSCTYGYSYGIRFTTYCSTVDALHIDRYVCTIRNIGIVM